LRRGFKSKKGDQRVNGSGGKKKHRRSVKEVLLGSTWGPRAHSKGEIERRKEKVDWGDGTTAPDKHKKKKWDALRVSETQREKKDNKGHLFPDNSSEKKEDHFRSRGKMFDEKGKLPQKKVLKGKVRWGGDGGQSPLVQ